MGSKLYLTAEEVKTLGVDITKLNHLRKALVLDEPRMFVCVSTLRQVEKVAEDHGMSFATQGRYSKINKEGMLQLEPGTVLGPKYIHGNFMVDSIPD